MRVTYGGKVFDSRTAAMLREVEKITGVSLLFAQGSYNANNVSASSGTHAGGGAVDVRTIPMKNRRQKLRVLKAMRQVGFAAWLRPLAYNSDGSLLWGEHIHGIAIGAPDLSSSARAQVRAYRLGRDGLAGDRPDPHAGMGVEPTTWERYKRSQKPTSGRATVVHPDGVLVRREPGGESRVVKRRPQGDVVTYFGVMYVDDVAYLRLLSGNWIRSSRTSRGA